MKQFPFYTVKAGSTTAVYTFAQAYLILLFLCRLEKRQARAQVASNLCDEEKREVKFSVITEAKTWEALFPSHQS